MNAGMKMMMVTNARRGGGQGGNRGCGNRGGSGGRSEMEMRNRGEMNYGRGEEMGYGGMEDEMESRRRYRRDSRGRFRSEMEMGGMEDEAEMRRGGGRGGSGGRNEMEDRYGRSEMESRRGYGRNEMESRRGGYGESEMRSEMRGYPNRPFPVYEGGGSNMNLIGFDPYREVETNYRMNATHDTGNEMEYKSASKTGGSSSSNMVAPMNKETAEEWTQNMKNEDGTKGPHWKMEQVKQLMAQKGIQYNPWEFFAILNALYSDYCAVLKKHGMNNIDVYVDLASAWLNDSDAMPEKAARYYEYIVKK